MIPMRSLVPRILRALVLAAVLFGFLRWLGFVASSIAFPFGGGEFHAMFAYTDEGHLPAALRAFYVQTGALWLAAALLVVARYPLPWWGIAAVSAVTGVWYWWGVVSWEPQSRGFHLAVLGLMAVIPVGAVAVSAIADRVARRMGGTPAARPA